MKKSNPRSFTAGQRAYYAKLRDPRWQKKRLEVMDGCKNKNGDFQCMWCRSATKTLTVHHLYYLRGNDPWDYPDSALIPLCEECHEEAESLRVEILSLLRSRRSQRTLLLLAKTLSSPELVPGIVPGAYHAINDIPNWLEASLSLARSHNDSPRTTEEFSGLTLHIIDMVMQANREIDGICSK